MLFWISFWIVDVVPSHCSEALGSPLQKNPQIFEFSNFSSGGACRVQDTKLKKELSVYF